MSVSSTGMIVDWRRGIKPCTAVCNEQFSHLLEEKGFEEIDSEEFFGRICLRYVNYSKLIHHRVKKYFDTLWGLHGVAQQFSKKDAKWLLPLFEKRVTDRGNEHLTLDDMSELLHWCAIRYNFWLIEETR